MTHVQRVDWITEELGSGLAGLVNDWLSPWGLAGWLVNA